MRILLIPVVVMLIGAQSLWAQTNLPYIVDFTEEIPSDWMVPFSDTLEWEHRADMGSTAPGSAIADLGKASDPANGGILTPLLNLSSAEKPVLRFHVAVVQNNFIGPALSLWYDDGTGLKYMQNWGTNLFQVEHEIQGSVDVLPPLNDTALNWNALEVDLSDLSSLTSVQFLFRADFANGGWVLIDDVEFVDASVSGVAESAMSDGLQLFPNPVASVLAVESGQAVRRAEILNTLGQVVGTHEPVTADHFEMSVADLLPGIYWLRLVGPDGTSVTRSFIRRSDI